MSKTKQTIKTEHDYGIFSPLQFEKFSCKYLTAASGETAAGPIGKTVIHTAYTQHVCMCASDFDSCEEIDISVDLCR
jgi:hypothetical protein